MLKIKRSLDKWSGGGERQSLETEILPLFQLAPKQITWERGDCGKKWSTLPHTPGVLHYLLSCAWAPFWVEKKMCYAWENGSCRGMCTIHVWTHHSSLTTGEARLHISLLEEDLRWMVPQWGDCNSLSRASANAKDTLEFSLKKKISILQHA